jgi:hypothetical protein
MIPVPISDPDSDGIAALLDEIIFKTKPCGSQTPLLPKPEIMPDSGAFMCWWRPSLWERIRLLCGANVRVMVNYSDHGPLNVDTMRDGVCRLQRTGDWLVKLRGLRMFAQ